ncbi:hypothetical protein F5884DRAFT_821614 [Xylogone sp. PMI_703]|nr:hypothetical protein F5884DRAFT_821614 [Xylogone sp. PMI_703]
MSTKAPYIPSQTRQHARRKSIQGPSTHSSNRVHLQPASPEVISSLITSLSIISSPANELFENPIGIGSQSAPTSPSPGKSVFNIGVNHLDSHSYGNYRPTGGSFGIDYGAYTQPSLRELREEESLDDLAASPPVIRTAKPPSGFSPLTAPKSPAKDSGSFKTLLRGSSRPSSKGSSLDDGSSIGNLSIEPGIPPPHELRRKTSGDSWGKKQSRNQKGLMYMSSKERLREKEQERKRASAGTAGSNGKGSGHERLPMPKIGSDSFMAETAITEEASTGNEDNSNKPESARHSRNSSRSPLDGPGGIGSGRFIPARDSSLRKSTTPAKKRNSHRSSRQKGKQRAEDGDDTLSELGRPSEQKRDRSRRPTDSSNKMMEPLSLEMPEIPSPRIITEEVETKGDRLSPADEADEGAPSPSVAQRRSRNSSDKENRLSIQKPASGKSTPEPSERESKRNSGSRLKRLSAPLSPRDQEKGLGRSNSSPISRATSPGPTKAPKIHVDERPNSGDSIDDAVEAYLCSPRLSQKIKHPQTGRVISFSEVGDSEGFAVFCCVGMGLTRYITAFYDELALTLKLRLITPDRPGVGESEPYADGNTTPLSWPDDVYAICQALKITKFSILAHSAGAIYALATALRMPQHIRGRIHLLAPWIPPSQMNAFGAQAISPPANNIPMPQRILRALPTPMLKVANSSFMSATSSSITSSLPKTQGKRGKRKSAASRDTPTLAGKATSGVDKENRLIDYPGSGDQGPLERALKDPNDPNSEAAILAAAASSLAEKERQVTYDSRLTHAIWDLATTNANPAVDLLVCLERRHTIGFRYVDINRAVVIHHGTRDSRVPVENVKWLGKTMRRCEVRILEGEGHGLMASAVVMGGILMEIAREWEDWVKVTGSGIGARGEGRRTLRERASVAAFR